MSEIRHRTTEESKKDLQETPQDKAANKSGEEEEEEDVLKIDDTSSLPQASDKTTDALDTALKDLPPRWRNWIIRGIFTWVMIFGFLFAIYMGPLFMVLVEDQRKELEDILRGNGFEALVQKVLHSKTDDLESSESKTPPVPENKIQEEIKLHRPKPRKPPAGKLLEERKKKEESIKKATEAAAAELELTELHRDVELHQLENKERCEESSSGATSSLLKKGLDTLIDMEVENERFHKVSRTDSPHFSCISRIQSLEQEVWHLNQKVHSYESNIAWLWNQVQQLQQAQVSLNHQASNAVHMPSVQTAGLVAPNDHTPSTVTSPEEETNSSKSTEESETVGGFTYIFAIQIKCFHEIITIGYVVYKSFDLPWFRTLSWYFLFASNYFFYGESLISYFGVLLHRQEFMWPFVTYHRFISFSLYVAGFVGFVCSLVKKHYLKQFTLFGWTHVTLLIVVTQSHLIMQNIFEGLIWLLVPVSMIICNDIMAYMFGFFFGKTPLIKLSPKKTWEGFIGGAVSTVFFGFALSYFLVQYDMFVCPISYDEVKGTMSRECERHPVFIVAEYNLPATIQTLFSIVGISWRTIKLYPFILHSISLSLFASVIGPFGGFFASGFKRAFKIKDFGDTIPGHGGIMDRFDCQFLMATFVHVYYTSFIRAPNPQKIIQNVLLLTSEEQVQVFQMLRDKLTARGLLVNSTLPS